MCLEGFGGVPNQRCPQLTLAILKRGITGSFHSVSEAHLQRYVDEFTFRWNHRSAMGIEDFERAGAILKGTEGKRLTYRRIGEGQNQ